MIRPGNGAPGEWPFAAVLAAAVAFSLNLNSYFLSDDFVQIGKVLQRNFAVTWGLAHGGFFRPLFIWSYVVDSWIWQARPFGYHLTNVALHGLNAFLVQFRGIGVSAEREPDAARARLTRTQETLSRGAMTRQA